jgi:hypothetical protein
MNFNIDDDFDFEDKPSSNSNVNNGNNKPPLIFDFGDGTPELEEKIYPAETLRCDYEPKCVTTFGVKDKIVITYRAKKIDEDATEFINVNQQFFFSGKPNYQLKNVIEAITGKPVFGKMDLKTILNKKVLVRIKHETSSKGNIYAKVDEVFPDNTTP